MEQGETGEDVLCLPGSRDGPGAGRSWQEGGKPGGTQSPGPRAVGLSTRSSSSGRKTDILTCLRLTGMADAISGHCHLAKTDMTCPYLQHFPHQRALQ